MLRNHKQDTSWMRPTNKHEANNLTKRQEQWLEKENTLQSGGSMGEWAFHKLRESARHTTQSYTDDRKDESKYNVLSLTQGAVQRYWRTPAYFPLCPQNLNLKNLDSSAMNPLESYQANLQEGKIFSEDQYGRHLILKAELSKDKDFIIVQTENKEALKKYYLCQIIYEKNVFVHISMGSYFDQNGAEKYFTLALGKEWSGGEVFEDSC
ncbi:hypothetical protein CCZ01_06725 [Helicobacter monodelphidis]|uniref:hypothetical protein n=1 Tax=Helicobacter sp. 15-1451 TaxID=2004995 RepID=UPI000DCE7B33|nr:hypothetical protein [Helicobacter sp. 15-1451]RAX57265.1 hypothetical protein CCZ01_06725 [Helicobacter sp. 15-1451]